MLYTCICKRSLIIKVVLFSIVKKITSLFFELEKYYPSIHKSEDTLSYHLFIEDKENKTTLNFHRKKEKNVKLTGREISLRSPVPFAYACVENSIEKGQGIRVKIKHIDGVEKKPNSFHLGVGISNEKPTSDSSLDFAPFLSTRMEKDKCLGDLFVCISERGKFHVCKGDSCLYSKALPPEMNPKSPVYVCFEIFRVRIELMETLYCDHSDAVENPIDPTTPVDSQYVDFVNILRDIDEKISTEKITPELQKKFSDDLTEYAKHISIDRSKSVYSCNATGLYLTPFSTGPIEEGEKMAVILKKLDEIQKRITEHHLERKQDYKKILEAIELNRDKIFGERKMESEVFKNHLTKNCVDFVANVDAFPLCDHLLQFGIFHQNQYEAILDEHKLNRQEARRSLFRILVKKEYTPEELKNIWAAFRDTKQESLLPKLGPA